MTDGAGAKHGEASLHEEHHGGSEEEVEDVEASVGYFGECEGGTESHIDALGGVSGGSFIETPGGCIEIICGHNDGNYCLKRWMDPIKDEKKIMVLYECSELYIFQNPRIFEKVREMQKM